VAISWCPDAAERRIRSAVPIARLIYLEPDLRRPTPHPPDTTTIADEDRAEHVE
jgi:hypothetical protein